MDKPSLNRNLTRDELAGAALAGLLIGLPILLLVFFPDAGVVRVVLGEGRVFIIWLVVFGYVVFNRGRVDAFFRRFFRR